jgi:hypothetical protein
VAAVFGARAEYLPAINLPAIMCELAAGRAVQLCLMPPGHYVAAVAWDKATEEIIYPDPWPGRRPQWAGDGFARRTTLEEEAAIQPYVVVYEPPA